MAKNQVKLYVLYDVLAQEASPITEAINDDVACRAFRPILETVVDPYDYQVVCIGSIDKTTCQLTLSEPRMIPYYFESNPKTGAKRLFFGIPPVTDEEA